MSLKPAGSLPRSYDHTNDLIYNQDIETVYGAAKATDHYLSSSRRDGVKINWEEPFSCMVYQRAIQRIRYRHQQPLRTLDVGAGTGDGFALLNNPYITDSGLYRPEDIQYLGLDVNSEMVRTASALYLDCDNARFQVADVRDGIPNAPFDLYLSCGVPYSHLTSDELSQTLLRLFRNVRRHGVAASLIIDVLGRYSIEWVPMWGQSWWDYQMSFFKSDGETRPMMMSFYDAAQLCRLIQEAAAAAQCPIAEMECFDRSIMAGRHTATGDFTPNLPPYRTLVNSLLDPQQTTDLKALLFELELGAAPDEVLRFFARFSVQWNSLIREAAELAGCTIPGMRAPLPEPVRNMREDIKSQIGSRSGPGAQADVIEPILASYLQRLEASSQPGLGVGHTLIAVVSVDAGTTGA